MSKKKKPVTIYKSGAPAGVTLMRQVTEEGFGGKTERRTSFIGVIYDKDDADAICEAMNRKQRLKD